MPKHSPEVPKTCWNNLFCWPSKQFFKMSGTCPKKCFLSDQILWFDVNWYHIIWLHMIWYNIIWIHMIFYDMISYDMTSYHMILYHIIGYVMISYDMIWQDKMHFLDMFRTCSKNVRRIKNEVFPKSFGDLWAMFWHHPWCLRAGLKFEKVGQKSKK